MKEENQAVIKALNMYGRVPEMWELLKEIERLNNIIKKLEELELYEFTPDYDYDENLIDGYTPFNIREYIQEIEGEDKE